MKRIRRVPLVWHEALCSGGGMKESIAADMIEKVTLLYEDEHPPPWCFPDYLNGDLPFFQQERLIMPGEMMLSPYKLYTLSKFVMDAVCSVYDDGWSVDLKLIMSGYYCYVDEQLCVQRRDLTSPDAPPDKMPHLRLVDIGRAINSYFFRCASDWQWLTSQEMALYEAPNFYAKAPLSPNETRAPPASPPTVSKDAPYAGLDLLDDLDYRESGAPCAPSCRGGTASAAPLGRAARACA